MRDWERKASESGQGPVGSWKLEEGGAEALPRTLANLEGRGRTVSPPQPSGPFIHSTQFMTWFMFGLLAEGELEESLGTAALNVNESILNNYFFPNANFQGDFESGCLRTPKLYLKIQLKH